MDVGGTLLRTARPVADIYLELGRQCGVAKTQEEISAGFKRAWSAWPADRLRYVGDGRPFWCSVVREASGCGSDEYFEAVYRYYERPDAWTIAEGAGPALAQLRGAGIKLAIVSNWDNRLRRTLEAVGCLSWFDAVVISAEVGAEKPDKAIFERALAALSGPASVEPLLPSQCLVVGDEIIADCDGARRSGMEACLFGKSAADAPPGAHSAASFEDVRRLVLGPSA